MKHLTSKQKRQLKKIIFAAVFFAVGVVISFLEYSYIQVLLFIAAYITVGFEILIKAVKGLFSLGLLDENFLMSTATIGAFILGEFSEGAAVMLFYQTGELLQSVAVSRSRRSISSLMELRSDYANVEREGEILKVDTSEVLVGEIITVNPGEKIPLDGIVTDGASEIDASALTGESLPRSVDAGDEVLSGSINIDGVIRIRTTKQFSESTVSKILELVENSAAKKSRSEAFITRFARWYTPAVVAMALFLALILSLISGDWAKWIYQALNFLVISCPCALVISVPLAFFGGIGAAAKHGILVKGGNYLEALAGLDTVVFDKTGTLTEGHFCVSKVEAYGLSEDELLYFAATAEASSSHPIARSVVEAYKGAVDSSKAASVREIAGGGVLCVIDGKSIAVGNKRLMQTNGIAMFDAGVQGTTVFVACDGRLIGALSVTDKVKTGAKQAIERLREVGVKRCVMLSGDNDFAVKAVSEELELDEYRAGLLPQDKVYELEHFLKYGKTAFVGDGINDAPVLSRSDVGIAMGGIGSDAALEAADVVLMDDEVSKIADAVKIARRTLRVSNQNIVFALGVKGIIMLLGILGIANMWLAVFADVGVSVLAILNSIRVMK